MFRTSIKYEKTMQDKLNDRDKKSLNFAKFGILLGMLSGLMWSIDGLLLGMGLKTPPLSNSNAWLFAPLFAVAIHDFVESVTALLYNCKKGKRKEILRTIMCKPGRLCILAAFIGAPLGMGGYLMSISLIGAAYALPITSLYPGVAAILALIFLKERISRRAWIGLSCCIIGAVLIAYTPPSSTSSELFYLGIFFAFLATIGWAVEGVCIASAVDFIDPPVAMSINKATSACIYILFLVPSCVLYFSFTDETFAFSTLMSEIMNTNILLLFFFAGLCGCVTYLALYTCYNSIGVSRGMALNITYSLWSVILAAIFTNLTLSIALVSGAIIIVVGMIFVIGNPRELLNLRKTD